MASILVVDDCREVAWIAARHLRGAGHRVTVAHDGAHALEMLAQTPPDCIVLDILMPVMTGVELLQELKRRPGMSDVPVVLVSSRVGDGRAHVVFERDADYCVGKPFTRSQIVNAVSAALQHHASRPTASVPASPA